MDSPVTNAGLGNVYLELLSNVVPQSLMAMITYTTVTDICRFCLDSARLGGAVK